MNTTRHLWFVLAGLSAVLTLAAGHWFGPLLGQTESSPGPVLQAPSPEQIQTAPPAENQPLTQAVEITADYSQEWEDGSYYIALLRGRCKLVQELNTLSAQQMIIWRTKTDSARESELIVYLEGQVKVDRPGDTQNFPSLVTRLKATDGVRIGALRRLDSQPATEDALYQRALERVNQQGGLPRRTAQAPPGQLQNLRMPNLQFPAFPGAEQQPPPALPGELPPPPGGELPPLPGQENPENRLEVVPASPVLQGLLLPQPEGNSRRVRIFPRSAVPYNIQSFQTTQTTPREQVIVISGGVNILIDGFQAEGLQQFGMNQPGIIDLQADSVVIWTQSDSEQFAPESLQSRDTPYQVYLEGNIVMRQGRNVVRATRAFYDVREERALLYDAELRSFVPNLRGTLRVRAERLRQLNRSTFHAQNAFVTTSTFGKPGYRVAATDIYVDERPAGSWFSLNNNPFDPNRPPVAQTVPWITSVNNTFLVEEVPVGYLPEISGPAEDPKIPLREFQISQDRIFGFGVKTTWDMAQLTGVETPPGVDWDLYLDYLSERGPAVGTGGEWKGQGLIEADDIYHGESIIKYQYDEGEDNLGFDRRDLEPEDNNRGRALIRHRHLFSNNTTVIGELGYLSDRNYLEQYYEQEFDNGKDNETLLYATNTQENETVSILGRFQVNEFDTTTEWLPRVDYTILSEPLFGGLVNYSSHSSAGYAQLRPGEAPTDPEDIFTPLPFVTNAEGSVLMTRHQLDMPFNLGPTKFVPYVMGEGAHWGEGFDNDDVDRLAGRAGLRSSIMFWRLFPYVQSDILGLNGLAHKIQLEADYSVTGATEDLEDIPSYNEFDDDAQERFRQRLVVNSFGGVLPDEFDPRFYAVRTGAGSSVTAPYHELLDDQQVLRMRVRQRLQTKLGPPERMRVVDWMMLDLEASYFPDPNRDNFGEEFGLLGARYRWNVSERTSFLANAQYDLFENAPELWDLGVLTQRSTRGSLYVGLRQVKGGPLDSRILTASYSYALSPKWVSTFGTAFDLEEGTNRGQSFTVTRIGSDFLVHVGAQYDGSKNNAGVGISIEPNFGPVDAANRLSSLLGGNIYR